MITVLVYTLDAPTSIKFWTKVKMTTLKEVTVFEWADGSALVLLSIV